MVVYKEARGYGWALSLTSWGPFYQVRLIRAGFHPPVEVYYHGYFFTYKGAKRAFYHQLRRVTQ